jgi:sugar lactone lactonase YvrE/DNA-binding IclR family transcriptional regulator
LKLGNTAQPGGGVTRVNAAKGVERDDGVREIPGAQALRRGLSLLDIVADQPGLRFTDLTDRSGLTKATTHRMLATLVEAGLLRIDDRDQGYHLGFRLFEMAHRVWDQFDLRTAAEPELQRLCDIAGETVRLGILNDDEILYVDQREALQTVRLGNGVGARVSAHASGAGKAILAHLDPLVREQLLNRLRLHRFTPRTITDPAALLHELDLIKARGYAISFEEQHVGVSSVAAAVLDHRANAIGAVAIVAPSYRLEIDRLHALGRDAMEAARRISGNAGQLFMSVTIDPRPMEPERQDVALAVPTSAFLGEGPVWLARERRLLFVDMLAPSIILSDPQDGSFHTYPMPELVSAVVPRRSGGFLAAMQSGVKTVDLASGAMADFSSPEAGRPGNRYNDGKCDRRGRFWVGTLALDTSPGQGSLYRLDADGRHVTMDTGFHVSNGLGWSPDDRTFYFTDSGARCLYRYDFDLKSGSIANRRVFAQVPAGAGTPGGIAVDCDGFVWSTQWGGWCVTRYDPDGRVERVINLPVPRPTSCAFGGSGLATLYVTTGRIRLSAQQLAEAPLSGSVFALQTATHGLPETPFAG